MGLPVFFDSSWARFSCSESRASARRLSRRERSSGSTSLHAGKASLGAGDGRVGVVFGGGFEALHHLFGRRVDYFEQSTIPPILGLL